jgi:NDP-sugar pyrophosphorylase family protein
MDIPRNPKLPETAQNLLNRLNCIEQPHLTLEEFLREVAYWVVRDGFDELKPKYYPHKPQRVIEFENEPLQERINTDYTKLCAKFPQVKVYYDTKCWVDRWNNKTLQWLEELLSYIPEDDILTRKKIENRILEFRAVIESGDVEIEKMKQIFEAREIDGLQ